MTTAERSFLALLTIGVFSIDSDGKIWRHRRMIPGGRSGKRAYWKLIKTRRAERSKSDGYPTVMFCDGSGVRHKAFAHRVVWMFHNKADILDPLEVNHTDGVRGNTLPTNLELITPSGNALHAIHILGRRAILKPKQVTEVRNLCKVMTETEVAVILGVSRRTVSNAVIGKTFKNVP